MVGAYDNDYDEGNHIYLCIFTDRAKDDRCEAIVFRFRFDVPDKTGLCFRQVLFFSVVSALLPLIFQSVYLWNQQSLSSYAP